MAVQGIQSMFLPTPYGGASIEWVKLPGLSISFSRHSSYAPVVFTDTRFNTYKIYDKSIPKFSSKDEMYFGLRHVKRKFGSRGVLELIINSYGFSWKSLI